MSTHRINPKILFSHCTVIIVLLTSVVAFFFQDLLTSSLLNEDGHKIYQLPHRSLNNPLQVCV